MKNRSTVVIYWELLKSLSAGHQGPSTLARLVNVPFERLAYYIQPLCDKGLIRKESTDGHDQYQMTPEGMELLDELDRALPRLLP